MILALVFRPAISDELREAELRNSIVIVTVNGPRNPFRSGSGFVVQSQSDISYVVTNADLIGQQASVNVIAPISGEVVDAQVMHVDSELNFALLKVADFTGRALVFGANPAIGDQVWSAIKWPAQDNSLGLARGRVLNPTGTDTADSVRVIDHSANISGSVGSVLLNDCGQVVGLNMKPGQVGARTSALDSVTLRNLLARLNVRTEQASGACIPVMVQAQRQALIASAEAERATAEAERAQKVAEEMEVRLAASNQRNASLEAEARAARSRAEEAAAAADEARKNAAEIRIELERRTATLQAETAALVRLMERDRQVAQERFDDALAQQRMDAETRERLLLIGIGLFLVAAVVVIGLLLRGRSNAVANMALPATGGSAGAEAQHKGHTELHKQDLVEYVLDGRDEDGIRYLLRISGDQLVANDGVVIGRNPQDSPYIINHADVSRKHARMKVMKNRVFIEDLGSTNGTSVNGQSIDDKGPVSIDNGDQIIIGSVVMKLRVLGA